MENLNHDEAPPPSVDLTSTVRRGRSLRRRRSAVRAIGTLAALSVLGGLGVTGVQALRADVGLGDSVGAPPAPPASATSPAPTSPAPTTQAPTTPAPTATQSDLLAFVRRTTLALLKPYGTPVVDTGYDRTGDSFYTGNYDFTDELGTTAVHVFVSRGQDPGDPDDHREVHPTSCADWDAGPCTERADGSLLVTGISRGYAETDSRDTGEYGVYAALYRPDRVVIRIRSSNGLGEKDRPLREKPALTVEQLTRMVTDPAWDDLPIAV